jgi:biotin synthase-related radical SAM superfamily protein
MIPMTDADIQAVREARQKVLSKMRKLTELPVPVAEDATRATLFRQLTDKVREHDERHRRLGIPPRKSSS